ncbi:DUF1488 family protein [Paraburkholderia sp. SIMBA_030]|uniref:DUF1488 family protein n=1 Tax=Paraburkholderia sp. SIMBA_030 TaxID=3085773 RepID=UPI00397DD176
MAKATYIDEGFRPGVTKRATVAFRVIFDDRHQVFEVSAEALQEYCDAPSDDREDLLAAFEDARFEILEIAETKVGSSDTNPILLTMADFKKAGH